MSTVFYIKEKEPTIQRQWAIGQRTNGEFNYNLWFMYDQDEKVQFPTREMLIDFIANQDKYEIIDEYGKAYTKEGLIKIIKGE